MFTDNYLTIFIYLRFFLQIIAYNGGFVYEKAAGDEFTLKYILNSEGCCVVSADSKAYESNINTKGIGVVVGIITGN